MNWTRDFRVHHSARLARLRQREENLPKKRENMILHAKRLWKREKLTGGNLKSPQKEKEWWPKIEEMRIYKERDSGFYASSKSFLTKTGMDLDETRTGSNENECPWVNLFNTFLPWHNPVRQAVLVQQGSNTPSSQWWLVWRHNQFGRRVSYAVNKKIFAGIGQKLLKVTCLRWKYR